MPKATWQLLVDWDNDGTFTGNGEDVTANLVSVEAHIGRRFPSQLTGNAVVGGLRAVLHDPDGTYVIGNTTSTLTGSLLPKRDVQLKITAPGTYTVWTGKLDTIVPRKSPGQRQEAVLTALGPLQELAGQQVSVPILSSVRTDEAVTTLLDEIGWPSTARAISTGQTTMTRWFVDGIDGLNALRQVEATESGFLHETKDGLIAFRDRHFRFQGTYQDSQGTWTDSSTGSLRYSQIQQGDALKYIYNDFRASVQEFSTAATATLWSNPLATAGTSAPLIEGNGGTMVVFASYPNANSAPTAFAVSNWITPAGTTDYIVTDDQAGTGNVLTTSVVVAVDTFSKSMKMTFTNNATGSGYFQLMQARGVPLNRSDPVTVGEVDTTSQTLYGTRTYPLNDRAGFIPDQQEAINWCRYNLAVYKDPVSILSVAFNPVTSTALMNEVMARDLNERVTVIATGSAGLYQTHDYYIESIRHRASDGGFQHQVVFELSPADPYSGFWVLGDGALGTTTRLLY